MDEGDTLSNYRPPVHPSQVNFNEYPFRPRMPGPETETMRVRREAELNWQLRGGYVSGQRLTDNDFRPSPRHS